MKDERLTVFVPQPPRLKSYTKRALLFLYSYGLLSQRATQRAINFLGLRLA